MKMSPSDYSDANGLRLGTFLWLILSFCGGVVSFAQTTFLDFNATGQYTNNFNAWNDNGAGVDAGNYCFTENATAGVGGGRGVNIFQSTDTTATYKSGSWDFSTNGATFILSTLIKANAQTGRMQFGLINTNFNGLNNNAGNAFETFRLFPTSG